MWKCVLLLYQMFTSLLTRLSCDSLRLKSTERRMIRTIIWTTWWGTSFSLRLVSYYLLMMTLYFQDSNFLSATGLLTGSVKRFSTMVRSGRDNRRILCYVSMGLVLVFFLLYYLISRIQQWLQLLTSAAQEDFYFVKQRGSAQRKTHEEATGRTNLLQLADEAWTYELFVTAKLVHTSYYHTNISKVTVVLLTGGSV